MKLVFVLRTESKVDNFSETNCDTSAGRWRPGAEGATPAATGSEAKEWYERGAATAAFERHPGTRGQDPGETRREEEGHYYPRQEELVTSRGVFKY